MGGTLEIHDGSSELSVYFRTGSPAKVRSSVPGRNLGQVLQMLKLVTPEELQAGKDEISEKGGLLGQVLIQMGVIDTEGLVRALREQMLLKMTDVFAMTNAAYAFYEKVNALVGFGPDELFPVDPYPLLMAGLRTHGKLQNLSNVCQPLMGKWVSTTDAKKVRRFRLKKNEKALLEELLESPRSVDTLLQSGQYDPYLVQYILYGLMITKQLKIDEVPPEVFEEDPGAERPSRLDSISPKPSQTTDPIAMEKKQKIMDKAAAIASQNYYEMLNLPFGAPTDEVRKAFFRLAREFHPDKVSKDIAADLKETLHYVFSNLSEAHATLLDHESREEYERAVKEGEERTSLAPESKDETEVRDALQAENFFQKATVFLRRGQFDKAEDCVNRALSLNPEEGEYIALRAHLESKSRSPDESVDDLLALLQQAMETNPNSERVNLYYAHMLKRTGQVEKAQARFKAVLQANAHNIEAARELRLMDMRKKKENTARHSILKLFSK